MTGNEVFLNRARHQRVTGVLLSLVFAGTLFSQFVMDFFSILLCLWMIRLYFLYRKTDQRFTLFPETSLEHIWVFWIFVVMLGFAINAAPGAPWLGKLYSFRWILLFYVLVASLEFIDLKPASTMKAMSWALLLCSLFALSKFMVLAEPRLDGLLTPMTFAHIYGPSLCLVVALGFACTFRYKIDVETKLIWLAAVIVAGLCVLLTFTRGVWFGCFVALTVMGFIRDRRTGFAIVLGGGLIVLLLQEAWPLFHSRLLQAFYFRDNYDKERVALWQANWHIFKQYPILGIGWGENWRRIREFYDQLGFPQGQFEGHAHNQYLQFMAGTGIMGLSIYLYVCIFFFSYALKLLFKTREMFAKGLMLGCIGAMLCFYLAGLTESNFEHEKVRQLILLVWALVMVYIRKENNRTKAKTGKVVTV